MQMFDPSKQEENWTYLQPPRKEVLIESSPLGSVYRVPYRARGSAWDCMDNGSHDAVAWHVVFTDGRRVAYHTAARAIAVIRGEKLIANLEAETV